MRLNRCSPNAPAGAYKTYSVRRPLGTHWRAATCEEVACPAYLAGWVTILPAGSEKVELVERSGRRFERYTGRLPVEVARRMTQHADAVDDVELGDLVAFVFPPGQACFEEVRHRVPLEREGLYVVSGGDWRGNPRRVPERVHQRPEDWVEDFSEHQQRVKTLRERG